MPSVVSDQVVEQFCRDGFAVIPNFLSQAEVEDLKRGTKQVVEKYCQDMPPVAFKAGTARNNYFAESGDKIRGFYEEKVIVDEKVVVEEKEKALNKIGHALHKFEDTFKNITFSSKVKDVVQRLSSMGKPTVIQSMVIFKQPKVGAAVQAHQDATYLHTEPASGSLIGFWIALDDANVENGCLYFSPGSHKEGKVYQRFIKNPDPDDAQAFLHTGEDIPESLQANSVLVPAPAKPGDLVLIDGLVIHQSESNTSDKPRLAYTFHVVDMSASYSAENWLQPTAENTFVELI